MTTSISMHIPQDTNTSVKTTLHYTDYFLWIRLVEVALVSATNGTCCKPILYALKTATFLKSVWRWSVTVTCFVHRCRECSAGQCSGHRRRWRHCLTTPSLLCIQTNHQCDLHEVSRWFWTPQRSINSQGFTLNAGRDTRDFDLTTYLTTV